MSFSHPNLLWIFCDQLRYHALSCNGDLNIQTPNIDRLASEGVRCTNAYSHYPVCVPFRAGLVTGQYATSCNVPFHGDILHPEHRTIADSFRAAGYRTSYVGKWHLAGERGINLVSEAGWAGEDYWVHPDNRGGFEDWFGFNLSNNFYRTFYCHGEQVAPFELDGYQTDALTNLSLEYLNGYDFDQPWFHVLSFESPHPGTGGNPKYKGFPVPAEYEEMFEPGMIELRDNVPTDKQAQARQTLCGYYAMIANLDDNVGRILDWLDQTGQANETLVVFFSDHGDMMGSQGLWHKQVPYDESIRVPVIFRLPKVLDEGKVYTGMVSGIDIYPTCAGLCQVKVDPSVQGMDLSGAIDTTGGTERKEAYVQWIGRGRFPFGDHPYRALRTRRYTYVVGRDEDYCLLFDNYEDPYQMNNLYHQFGVSSLQETLHLRLVRTLLHAGESRPDFI